MKKIKLLMPIVGASITAIAPITTLTTSCSKTNYDEVRDQILNEFKKLCDIPHSSDKVLRDVLLPWDGNVWNMSCYLYDVLVQAVGASNVNQDLWGNIWCDVPANDEAYKDYPRIGLQAHMDMVFSYDSKQFPTEPDPTTTKIELVDEVKDGKRVLHSKDYKTTIGADDGIGVATILTLVKSKTIKHGPLRVVLTNCEEKAMQGAQLLIEGDEERFGERRKGHPEAVNDLKYLINLDGEDLGDVCVGCSGGVGSYYEQAFEYTPVTAELNKFDVAVHNFAGGHSGSEIDKYRANPIKFLTTMMLKLFNDKFELINFDTPGVIVYNKIPDKCVVSFATDKTMEQVEQAFKDTLKEYKEMKSSDKDSRGQKPKFGGEDWDKIEKSAIIQNHADSAESIKSTYAKQILDLQDKLAFGVEVWPSEEDMAKFVGEQTSASVGPVHMEKEFTEEGKNYVIYTFASYSRSTEKAKVEKFAKTNVEDSIATIKEKIRAGKKKDEDAYSSDAKFPAWKNLHQEMANLAMEGWKASGVDSKNLKFSRTHGGIENSWWFDATYDEKTGAGIKQTSIGCQLHDCHEVTETCEVDTIIPFVKTVAYVLQNIKQLEK